jgi:DNA-binding transcriptional MerR regulator
MKTKPVHNTSLHPDRARDAATSSALQVKSGLTIGALARATGLRPSAIRYYERLGLVPASARRSGWRVYSSADVGHLRRLTAARTLGFSLRQLKALGDALSNRDALAGLLQAKSAEIDTRIASLTRARAALTAMLACDCANPGICERVG